LPEASLLYLLKMPKPNQIELPTGDRFPILYEDRSVLAIDKPAGWMLVPFSWQKTDRNLQAAIVSSIAAKDFWARSRGLKFLRFVHRLDGDTSGILLLAKSPGAVTTFGNLFEGRKMEKVYLAVVVGAPQENEWTCRLKLGQDNREIGRMRVDARGGKEAETHFRLLQKGPKTSLIEARPVTGRTHQIRVHLAESGCPVVEDKLYGKAESGEGKPLTPALAPAEGERENRRQVTGERRPQGKGLGLRAVRLRYEDPFTRRRVDIRAPMNDFVHKHGFNLPTI
jgi:23S rRNA pseudouridine1911/1915/1917 synthase